MDSVWVFLRHANYCQDNRLYQLYLYTYASIIPASFYSQVNTGSDVSSVIPWGVIQGNIANAVLYTLTLAGLYIEVLVPPSCPNEPMSVVRPPACFYDTSGTKHDV